MRILGKSNGLGVRLFLQDSLSLKMWGEILLLNIFFLGEILLGWT